MRLSNQTKVWRTATRLVRRAGALITAIAAGSLVVTASVVSATTYEYDVHGRLTKVTAEDGSVVIYAWDKATNRTQAQTYLAPGVPPSISVPSSSSTGSFTVSWGATSGTISSYQLYEATNSSFSGQVLAYSGTSTSFGVSGKGNGTYYYRVRACNTVPCSDYRTGANGSTVTLPPGIPAWISVPSTSNTGSYTVSWGASSGIVSSYQLYEATNSSFSDEVLIYNNTGTSHAVSKSPGTYFYRVRACNVGGCSDFRTSTGVNVPLPIQVLNPSIHVTASVQTTGIATLANLNGHAATIHSFSLASCSAASAAVQSDGQSVRWTNHNWYYRTCDASWSVQCSATYVIRNSGTGQLHNGSSAVTVSAYGRNLPPGYNCP